MIVKRRQRGNEPYILYTSDDHAGVTFTGVSVGSHVVTARLAASVTCISSASTAMTVDAVPAVPATPTASVTVQPTCAVPTGTIVVSAPLGATYEYSLDLSLIHISEPTRLG